MPFKYEMEHVCTYRATLSAPEVIGALPNDIRANFYVTGGEVWGPKLRGKVRAVGGDWLTLRPDGVCVLDVHATLESHDGALIDVRYNGILDLGTDGYAGFLRGDLPAMVKIYAAPLMRTAHPDYAWVNRKQFVNIGEAKLLENHVTYDVYAVN